MIHRGSGQQDLRIRKVTIEQLQKWKTQSEKRVQKEIQPSEAFQVRLLPLACTIGLFWLAVYVQKKLLEY